VGDTFQQLLQKTGEYGIVYQVSHPIVFIDGLPNAKTHEVVVFESGQKGEIFSINRGKIEVRTFSHEPVLVGSKVARTDQLLSVPAGRELLGHTINPLGEPIDPSIQFTMPTEMRDLDANPVGISGRQKISTPLLTGISLVDLLLPLGVGQRELIIGDRKTGKTSLLMTTIKNQVYQGMIVIYAAIAKKKSDIKKLQGFFEQEKIMSNMIIVATSSFDSPSLIYQTPYAGMALAEYFRDQGVNTLLILDDLSTHAKFYRELSLLARRFPGRDSYPGDIFYTHSRLLERAGNFKHPTAKEVAITCLPVVEIVEGDFTGYISTNVMGITDGHIYLDSNIYYQGMRPAVNVPLSVTRVGRQTLDKLSRDVNKNLTSFLAEYTKLQNISHFGQELTAEVKKKLLQGDLMNKFFNQPYQQTVPHEVQLIVVSMILHDLILTKEDLDKAKENLIRASYDKINQKLFFDITNTKDVKVLQENIEKNKEQIFALAQMTPVATTPPAPAPPSSPQPPETTQTAPKPPASA
jgi:F-type H+-transporting ATPase subunit alpha